MATNFDIKEMIAQAFHEIYDQPLDLSELDGLFDKQLANKFNLNTCDYDSKKIYEYIEEFLGQCKHSFVNPVLHYFPSQTPLDEINNMFYKFTFIVNLYYIHMHSQSQQNEEIGLKRKLKRGEEKEYNSHGIMIPSSYDDLPIDTIITLTPRLIKLM